MLPKVLFSFTVGQHAYDLNLEIFDKLNVEIHSKLLTIFAILCEICALICLSEDQSYDDSLYSNEKNFEALDHEDVHLGMSSRNLQNFTFRIINYSNDYSFNSDEEELDAFHYEDCHLGFDPEKSPKFHY
nr:glycosyl transferase [Tanacetum cinerariifolium]